MNIEWWMIDGAIGLIVLAAAIVGAAKGIGDTILRIVGIVGGLALGTVYSAQVKEWLATKKFSTTLHDHIFEILRGEGEAAVTESLTGQAGQGAAGSGDASPIITPDGDTSFLGSLSRSLGDMFGNAADKAADAAADRLTDLALGIFAFALIMLAVMFALALVRLIIKAILGGSVALGFANRVLGFVLGGVRGLLLAWVAVALLIPATTLFSPENVPAMIKALQQTTAAKVLYDVNPLLMLVKYVFKA